MIVSLLDTPARSLHRCLALVVLLASILALDLRAQQPMATIVVRVRAGASAKALLDRAASVSGAGSVGLRVRRALEVKGSALMSEHRLDRYHLVSVAAERIEAVLAALHNDPDVEVALPNHRYRLDGIPTDPRAVEQWALRRIEAEGAWRLTLGADSIVIGFVDTGIDYTHPDLAPSLWINRPEDRNGNRRLDAEDLDGVDQDGNGVVDDVIGYDFVDQVIANLGDWSDRDGDPFDEEGHGTTVAGVMAAAHDNDVGIAGLAPRSPLMTLRAFDATGNAEDDDVAAAIVYAANNGVRVLNLSFGDVFYSPLMHDAIRYAVARGVTVVASAGNEGTSEPHYPSSYPEVISVAMSDSNDLRNELSNFGSQLTVSAPGVEVLSTARDTSYRLAGGTSIAAPYVSGLAALILSRHPSWSPDQVRGVIELTADDRRPTGWDPFYGAGRINARRAVAMEGPVSLAITSPLAESGVRGDSTLRIVGSAHTPFLSSWQLSYALGDLPDTGGWRSITPPMSEGRIHATLGELSTAGLPDTVVTLRLVLRQTDGRVAERRVRIHLDRTAPLVRAFDVRNVWKLDDRAIGITASTDDRTRLTAMIRPTGSSTYRAVSLEPERSGLARTHYLVLSEVDMPRGVAHDLYLVLENATGDTTMIGAPDAPLAVTRDDESFPQRGFTTKPFELPYGFMLNDVISTSDPNDRTLALNRFEEGTFGKLVIYAFAAGRFAAIDSLAEEWLPRDFGDSDADGLRELLVQSGSATRIYEQRAPGESVLGTVLFDDATAQDLTLHRTLGARLVDVDGDGRDELIGRTDPRVLLIVDGDTLPPHYFIARNEGGAFRVVARLDNPTRAGFGGVLNQYGPPVVVVADVDGDGAVEILIGDDDADFILHARDGDQWRVVWTEENDGKGSPEMLTSGDFDGNGRVEVVTGYRSELNLRNDDGHYEPPFWSLRIRRFDGPNYAPSTMWEDRVAYVRRTDPFRTGASAGNLDGRPGDELALSIFPSMYVFRWTGSGLRMHPLWWRYGSVNNQPIIADFDRDGIAELGVGDGARIAFHQIDLANRGPDVPGGLTGWATSDSTTHLDWSPVDGADLYRIYRGVVIGDSVPEGFSAVVEVTTSSFDDAGMDLPGRRLQSGARYAYAVTAIDSDRTPSEGDYGQPIVVFVHALARPLAASAPTDSSIALELSVPIREDLYRTGAFDVRRASGQPIELSSVTSAGERRLVLHVVDPPAGDSVVVRLTALFRDVHGAPGDTTVAVGLRMPEAERPDERFIATRADFEMPGSERWIVISFNAPVDRGSGERVEKYVLHPVLPDAVEYDPVRAEPIVRAELDPDDPTRVRLLLDPTYPIGALGRSYTVTVRGVRSSDGRAINDGTESVVGLIFEGSGVAKTSVYPQPFSITADGEAVIAGLPRDATVVIWTQHRQLVRTLREIEHNGGVRWDGRDESGRPVPSGIYLYRIRATIDGATVESDLRKIAVVP